MEILHWVWNLFLRLSRCLISFRTKRGHRHWAVLSPSSFFNVDISVKLPYVLFTQLALGVPGSPLTPLMPGRAVSLHRRVPCFCSQICVNPKRPSLFLNLFLPLVHIIVIPQLNYMLHKPTKFMFRESSLPWIWSRMLWKYSAKSSHSKYFCRRMGVGKKINHFYTLLICNSR